MVGHAELVGRGRPVFHPIGIVEHIGVQGGDDHGLVAPVAETAPQADARFVPGAGHHVELTFGTVAGEEAVRFVGEVGLPDGHDDVSQADVEALAKRFLDPELFQRHFAAALYLVLELAGFLGFHFHGHFAAAVLKLDFAAHAPAFAEVVSQVDDHVGQVDATMAFGVFVPVGM